MGSLVVGVWCGTSAWAEAPLAVPAAPEPAPHVAPAATALSVADEARLRDLLAPTQTLSAENRAIYLRGLREGNRESPGVNAGLDRAIIAAQVGETYAGTIAIALGSVPTPDPAHYTKPAEPPRAISPELLAKVREYRRRRLEVRGEVSYSGGGSSVSPSPFGMGGVSITQDPISSSRSWAVYEGPLRLDVPSYYASVGQFEKSRALTSRVKRKQWVSRIYYGVGVAGVVTSVVGYFGSLDANSPEEARTWATVGAVGLGASLVGMIGGSFPAASASKLRSQYSKSVDIGEAQQAVEAQNERIRSELELTPEQVFAVEVAPETGTMIH